MKIYGLDFTSAPSQNKPITCVSCEMEDDLLSVKDLILLTKFEEFEAFLSQNGSWVAGIDFPFGQPKKLVVNLSWPETWEGYVGLISVMGKASFEDLLTKYRSSRPKGDKHHLRAADLEAGACSPMMLYGVPVGKMFFQGAPRLLKSHVSVLPCRPTNDSRIVVEAYPALVARKWIEKLSYKTDDPKKQTAEREAARRRIVGGVRSHELRSHYGFDLELNETMAQELIVDPTGDNLDALLCAIQAAWAYSQQHNCFGIPQHCDRIEGCIVDPSMVSKCGRTLRLER